MKIKEASFAFIMSRRPVVSKYSHFKQRHTIYNDSPTFDMIKDGKKVLSSICIQ